MILTGVALLPVVFWFLKFNINIRTRLIGSLFILLFSKGFLELVGIPNNISSLICELHIILMLVIFKKSKNSQYPGWFLIFGIFLTGIISTVNNQTSIVQFLLFFREYFEVIIFFYLIINIHFIEKEIQFLIRLIIFLFISQIFANLIKLIILQDIVEPYIGTIAVLGGSKTMILALVGGSYFIVQYLLTNKRTYLIGLLGFIIFSLIGGKRATILYFPLIYLISYFIFQFKYSVKQKIALNKLVPILTGGILIFYFTARLLPTLNPEKQIGGSFDLTYIIEYSESYTSADYINEIGRSEAPAYLVIKLLNDGYDKLAFGYGTGHLIKSSYNENTVNLNSDEITSTKYGVGYGARTGFLQFLLQIGVIGVIFILFFFLFIMFLIWRIKTAPVVFRFTSILLLLILLMDFFTYSYESLLFSAIGCSIFFFQGITIQLRSK